MITNNYNNKIFSGFISKSNVQSSVQPNIKSENDSYESSAKAFG